MQIQGSELCLEKIMNMGSPLLIEGCPISSFLTHKRLSTKGDEAQWKKELFQTAQYILQLELHHSPHSEEELSLPVSFPRLRRLYFKSIIRTTARTVQIHAAQFPSLPTFMSMLWGIFGQENSFRLTTAFYPRLRRCLCTLVTAAVLRSTGQ